MQVLLLTLHDGGRYYIETSPLICCANQWTGFYIITASVMKELMNEVTHVSVLYRHSQDLRHLSPQNGISLKEFETTTREIGLIIYLSKQKRQLCLVSYKVI